MEPAAEVSLQTALRPDSGRLCSGATGAGRRTVPPLSPPIAGGMVVEGIGWLTGTRQSAPPQERVGLSPFRVHSLLSLLAPLFPFEGIWLPARPCLSDPRRGPPGVKCTAGRLREKERGGCFCNTLPPPRPLCILLGLSATRRV